MIGDAKINEQAKTLTFVLDLEERHPSASGKTLVVASTRGNVPTSAMLKGQPIVVGVNA